MRPLCYVDTSALVSLFYSREASHSETAGFLTREDVRNSLCTSVLTTIEAARVAIRNSDPDFRVAAHRLLAVIEQAPLSEDVIARACDIPQVIKTLDAIHLATAIELDAKYMVTLDRQLAAASTAQGLIVPI